jgi:hypothetical protein
MIGSDCGHNDSSEEWEHVATIRARQDVFAGFAEKLRGKNVRAFHGLQQAAPQDNLDWPNLKIA